jgi:hypothetical protein
MCVILVNNFCITLVYISSVLLYDFSSLTIISKVGRSHELTHTHHSLVCITCNASSQVHARDIVTELIASKCDNITKFEWTKQLRYQWDEEQDTCLVQMSNATITYSYVELALNACIIACERRRAVL